MRPAERLQLRRGPHPQPALRPRRDHTRQRHHAGPTRLQLRRRAALLDKPAPHQHAILLVAQHLGRVETAAIVHKMLRGRREREILILENANIIYDVQKLQGWRLHRDEQRLLRAKIEPARALPHRPRPERLGPLRIARQQRMDVAPMEQILRLIEQDHPALIHDPRADDHIPPIVATPDEGIAKIPTRVRTDRGWRPLDDGIQRVLLPRQQIVIAGRQADDLGIHAGIDQRGRAVVIDSTARPAALRIRPAGRGRERDRPIPPVDQILADGVPPMNRAVKCAVGIVLIKEMIASLPLDEAIGIVHPIGRRQKMIARTMRILVTAFRITARFPQRF